jgi:hypothetical protein
MDIFFPPGSILDGVQYTCYIYINFDKKLTGEGSGKKKIVIFRKRKKEIKGLKSLKR